MSNKITIKRSSVAGKVPLPGDLEYGEFALNYTDGNLFFKDSSNNIATLASTQFVNVTGNITGGNIYGNYLFGDGGFLSNVTVSSNVAVTQIANGTSVISVNGSGGDVLFSIGGVANVAVITPTGLILNGNTNITGEAFVTGNINAGPGSYFLGDGSQLTGIQTVSSELINGSKTFSLNSNGTVDMPVTASMFDATQDYLAANVHVLDEFDKTVYQTAKYLVQATSGSNVHSTELLLTHNTVNTFMTEYATLISGTNLIELDSYIDDDQVVLTATTLNADTQVDFFRIALLAAAVVPGCGIEGDLELQSGIVDLMVGSCTEDLNEPVVVGCDIEGDLELQSGTVDLMVGSCTEDLNTV
jgi:hypothetical protein